MRHHGPGVDQAEVEHVVQSAVSLPYTLRCFVIWILLCKLIDYLHWPRIILDNVTLNFSGHHSYREEGGGRGDL